MEKVTIVGAGIAGLTASLRLLERGFHVTLFEQDNFIGGMLRSHKEEDHGDYPREHSYHMLCNWYYNFWSVAKDLKIEKNFTPRESFKFLHKGCLDDMPEMMNPGGIQDFYKNLTGGAAPPADLFLFMYSMIDLLSIPDSDDDELDKISFNGWLRSRPYCTDKVASLHEKIWQTVWAIDSWQASARSYKTFLKYGNRVPVPQLWLFNGSKKDMVLDPFQAKLNEFSKTDQFCTQTTQREKEDPENMFVFKPLHRLRKIEPAKTGNRIGRLIFDEVDKSPSVYEHWNVVGECKHEVDAQNVVICTTPGAFAKMVTGELYTADPDLGQVRYLEAEPMASVELYLKKKLTNIPAEVVVFMDTKYEMTFLDYSQTWGLEKTFLYVTVSDFKSLLSAKPQEIDKKTGHLVLDLDHPKTAIDYILKEVAGSIGIHQSEIDLTQTSIDTNTGEELFANLTGSWQHRPEVKTKFANMYLAGTYVKNFADVATVEGACATGLIAAEYIRQSVVPDSKNEKMKKPIQVIEPDFYPSQMFKGLKVAWAPYAATAKAWSVADKAFGINKFWPTSGFKLPKSKFTPSPDNLGSLFTDWLPASKWQKETMGLGPLYWNYTPDGKRRSN